MSNTGLQNNIMLLGAGVDACIEKKLVAPALVLIYSAIDTVGWLDSNNPYATKDGFLQWVDTYLLKAKILNCKSIDLYAARCGLLHTFSSDSRLSSFGKARQICYAWGKANVEDLQKTIDCSDDADKYVAVHVNDLYEAWRMGVLLFTNNLEKDLDKNRSVCEKADRFFCELSMGTINDVLANPGA
jgi:hypothetical protein